MHKSYHSCYSFQNGGFPTSCQPTQVPPQLLLISKWGLLPTCCRVCAPTLLQPLLISKRHPLPASCWAPLWGYGEREMCHFAGSGGYPVPLSAKAGLKDCGLPGSLSDSITTGPHVGCSVTGSGLDPLCHNTSHSAVTLNSLKVT